MSEQNQVILDTSQAKSALAELEVRLKSLDRAMEGVSAEKLIGEYKRLVAGAAALRAEMVKLSAAKGPSAEGMKKYQAELASVLTKIGQLKASSQGLQEALVKQGLAVGSTKAAMVSYRAVIDGVGYSFREAGKYSQDYVKVQAELQRKARELRKAEEAAGSQNVALMRRQAAELRAERRKQEEIGAAMSPGAFSRSAEYRSEVAKGAAINALVRRQAAELRAERRKQEEIGAAMSPGSFKKTAEYKAQLQLGNEIVAMMRRQSREARGSAASEVDKLGNSLAVGSARLKDTTNGFTKFTAAQWEAHSAARGLAGAMGQLWLTYGNLAPLLAGAAVGAAVRSAVQAGTEFQYQLTFVKALGGESAEAVKRLSDESKKLATTGLFGPIEVANGLRILTQAGLDANKAIAVLPATLDLATVGEMKLEDSAITLAGVMEAFNKKFYEASRVGDVFAKAAAESQVSVMDMTESMKTASVVGQQYGASMEDTATALTLLGQLNIRGSAAGTALRNMLKELYTPGKEASDMMATLGLKAFDAKGKMKDFPSIIYELKSSLEGFDAPSQTNILQTLFGERGAKEAIAMLSKTREEWDALRSSLSDSEGFMRSVAAELEATTKGNLAQAFNTLKVTMIETFESTEGAVGELAMKLKSAFASDEFKEALTGLASAVTIIMQAVAAATPVLTAAAGAWVAYKATILAVAGVTAVSGVIAKITGSVIAMTGAMGPAIAGGIGLTGVVKGLGAATALAAGPIGLTVAALGGFAYWVTQSANAPFSSLIADTGNLARAMESLRDKTKAASDALLAQMRARGMAAGSEADDAKITMEAARKRLDEARAKQADALKLESLAGTIAPFMSPISAAQGIKSIVSKVKGAKQLAEAEESVANAEKAYKEAEKYHALQKERADTLKMADQIDANATEARVQKGARSLAGEQFISAGKKVADPIGVEIANLTKQYEEIKKAYADQPGKLAEAKASYDQQVSAILSKKSGGSGGGNKVDRTPLRDARDVRKEADAEYEQAKASVDFYKKGLEIRRDARMVGEKEYNDILDALADKEIELGIRREQRVQSEIADSLKKVKDQSVRDSLDSMMKESVSKQAALETQAIADKGLKQLRAQADEKKLLEDLQKMEAESFSSRLTEQERFIDQWVENNRELIEKTLLSGNQDNVDKLMGSFARGRAEAEKADRSNFAAAVPGDTAAQLATLQDRYKDYYDTLERYRATNVASEKQYADAIVALEMKKQQELMDIHVEAAKQRLELGTGGFEDMQLASLARLTEGYTTFSAGATELMGNFFQSFTDGFADSIGRAIVYSDDLNSALKSVADDALASLISGLVKLGIQWIINAAIGNSIQATAAAASMEVTSATAAAAAEAWTPAATLASLASFGGNAAPAIAGMLATTGVAQMIAATANFAGAFDKGGTIPGGKWGIVGEFGPEIVQGPANVTSREKTMEMVRTANQPAAPAQPVAPIVNLKNINVLDKGIVGDYLSSPSGEKLLMNVIQKNRKALA